jgi:hypothetical protein
MNVLALEGDASQTEAIRYVVCNLVGARLTVATSIEQALLSLRESTPDLVLLPTLVSPSQESALLDTLRSLPDASHVETQISPVLPSRDERLIVTPGWRRWTSRRAVAPPAASAEANAFGERVHWALERARERKAHGVPINDRQEAATHEHAAPVTEAATDAQSVFVAVLDASPHPVEASLIEPVSMSLEGSAPVEAPRSRSLVELLEGFNDPHVPDAQDLELADATSRLLKKLGPPSPSDRRQFRRFAASELPGLRSARIKFGPSVALVDVSAGGALLETDTRLKPDSEALLELIGSAGQAVIPFRVVRCQISALNGSPRYLGACAFKEPLDLDDLAWTATGLPALDAEVPALTLVPPRVAARNAW